jgi:hypothetical protein
MLKIGNQVIKVTHPDGTELTMEGGKLTASAPSHRSLEAQFNEELGKEGVKWGDAVAWITKKVGIEQCAACRSRQYILNHLKQLGVRETVRQIKETFSVRS